MANKPDISMLPPPPVAPVSGKRVDISGLPPPPVEARVDISALPPPPSSVDRYQQLRKEDRYQQLRKEIEGSDFDILHPIDTASEFPKALKNLATSPKILPKLVTQDDITAIAEKHGVDPAALRKDSGFQGAFLEDASPEEMLATGTGVLTGSVLAGVGQKIARKAATPEMERALDDIRELAEKRKPLLLDVVDVALPGGVIATSSKRLLPKLLAGAATGATYGTSGSRQGEEIPGAIGGAVLGTAFAGVGPAYSRIFRRAGKPLTEAAAGDVPVPRTRGGADYEKEIVERLVKTSPVDDLVANAILDSEKVLTQQERRSIAETYQPDRLLALAEKEGMNLEKAADQVSQEVINKQAGALASDIGIESTGSPIAAVRQWAGQNAASGQGYEAAANRLKRQLWSEHVGAVLDEKGFHGTDRTNFLGKVIDFFSDDQFVLRSMDEKLPGLGIEGALKEMNRGLNQLSYPKEKMRAAINNIFLENQRKDLDRLAREAGSIIQKVESEAGPASLTKQEKEVYEPISKYFSDALSKVNAIASEFGLPPLNIKARPNYIPAQLISFDRLDQLMQDRVAAIVADASALAGRGYKVLEQIPESVFVKVMRGDNSATHRETVSFIHLLSRGEAKGEGTPGLARVFKQLFVNPDNRQQLETVAKAALEREDLIPQFARETDLYKLMDKWTNNTLRQLFIREPMDKLRKVAETIENRGMGREAEYLKTLLADMNGVRKGTMAAYSSKGKEAFLRWADKKMAAAPPEKKEKWETIRSVPFLLEGLTRNVHTNLLGGNPRNVIMNLTQTPTKTIPEFGIIYGSSLALRGATSLGRGEGMRGVQKALKEMEALGIMPAKYVGGNLPYLSEGISRSPLAQKVGALAQKSSDLIMVPFELAEKVNRGLAFRMSQVFIDDLVKGSAAARKSLSDMPTSVYREVEAALKRGDRVSALRSASEHIINSTQYQYNRASQSQYGRTMGPLFSQFSKWPTATLGQVAEAYRTKGLAGGTIANIQKLVVPLLLLEAGDMIYLAAVGEEEFSDREAKFVGRSGLSGAAPIGNLVSMARGDFFTPPVVSLGMKMVIEPLKRGEKGNLATSIGAGLQDAVYQFAPGGAGGWVRLITDDMVTAVEGKRPEGPGFLDRAGRILE